MIFAAVIAIAATYAYGAARALYGWRRHDARSLRWVSAAMCSLLGAYVIFAFWDYSLEQVNDSPRWAAAFILLTLGFWLLLRFATEVTASPRWVRRVGDLLAGASIALQLAIPGRVAVGYVEPSAGQALVHASITLSSIFDVVVAALLLWRGGRSMPDTVRRRFRTLAIAIPLLYVAQVASGVREAPAVYVITILQVSAISLVVLGAVPPRWLRNSWQAPQLRRVLREIAEVSALTDESTVRAQLLPTIARVASARRATMRDAYTGEVLGTWGSGPDAPTTGVRRVRVPASSMELELVGAPHDPFFGREEQELVRGLGVHLDVALDRCRLIERERLATAVTSEANRTLNRANADLRELAELRDNFVAMASHELRTPITTIMGFTSTMISLWDRLDEDERLRYLGLVDRDAQRLGQLVEDLLLLSEVESANFRVVREPIDPLEVIAHVVRDLDGEAAGIEVVGEAGLLVSGDPRYLRQVVGNLLGNALKHGAAPITLRVHAPDGSGPRIEVADCGVGIPVDFRPRVFGRFSRAPQASTVPGSGLGLFIVRRLVELQGGRVWHEPVEPQGARFVVEFVAANAPTPVD